MLVWTQPVYGVNERTGFRLPKLRLPQLDSRAWAAVSFFPLVLIIALSVVLLCIGESFNPVPVIFFLSLTVLSRYLIIDFPGKFVFDLEPVVTLASFLVIGPLWTFVNTFVMVTWYEFFVEKKDLISLRVSNAEVVLVTGGFQAIFYKMTYHLIGPFFSLALTGAAGPFVNAFLASAATAIRLNKSVREIWKGNEYFSVCIVSLTYIPVGYLFGRLFLLSPVFALLFVSPIFMLYLYSKLVYNVKHEIGTAIQGIGDILEERDGYTFGHTLRVAEVARTIAQEMKLKSNDVDMCVRVARLHDIGKISVPDIVLKKEGTLTKEEYRRVQRHVEVIPELFPEMYRFGEMLNLAMHHHERYDGAGYPFGLKGEKIPLIARVVSVADAWDAMTSRRVYRANLPEEKALQTLRDLAGKQWDPNVVDAFMKAHAKGLCRPAEE